MMWIPSDLAGSHLTNFELFHQFRIEYIRQSQQLSASNEPLITLRKNLRSDP